MIQANAESIRGKRTLDIASHDGRWSFAAYKAGAEYVLGIEARSHLINLAYENMQHYGVPRKRVEFAQGDALQELDRLDSGSFDTVFCFGFLYHTADHMLLMRKIGRLQPTSLIIDTAVSTHPGSIVEIHDEAIAHESAGAVGDPRDPERTVVGIPSKPALELMLRGGRICRWSVLRLAACQHQLGRRFKRLLPGNAHHGWRRCALWKERVFADNQENRAALNVFFWRVWPRKQLGY